MNNDNFFTCAKIVIKNRPKPRTQNRQFFMVEESMVVQAKKYYHYLKNKNIVFLGDGDGASIYYGLLLKYGLVEQVKAITLLDFDERILNYHNRIYTDFELANYYDLSLIKYNVLNPIPENLKGKYDFFYINPPYGSLNEGNSIIAWLHRCIDLCSQDCMGCLIIPYDKKYKWSIENFEKIKQFLLKKGFEIIDQGIDIHDYDFANEPTSLKSSTFIVKKTSPSVSEYNDLELPNKYKEHFYGKYEKIPEYIIDNNSEYGIEKFNEGD